MIVIILFVLMMGAQVLIDSPSEAASCTPGTDCYCDRVKNVSNPIYDPNLVMCEDFEAPTLYQTTGSGGTSPYYGPWFDATGNSGDRGYNSYWRRLYNTASDPVASNLWTNGQPTSPANGSACGIAQCTGVKSWDATDRWGGNTYTPRLGIYTQSSDFSAEVGTLSAPTNARGGASGVFDGNANLAHRVATGDTAGLEGSKHFSPALTTIGFTMALAYPSNSNTSGIWGPVDGSVNAAWKHNEWGTVYNPSFGLDGLFVFYDQNGTRDLRPFSGFFSSYPTITISTACASTVVTVGRANCHPDGYGVQWGTSAAVYSLATDWPWGTWGCVRGYLENVGQVNQRYRVWFQGPNMTSERLIVDISMDARDLNNRSGYEKFSWNAYANTNQGGGYVATSALTFRYEDNVHIRNGSPVPCSQIGFGGTTPDITPPAAPTGVIVSKVK